ncbi:D-lactate dehydrogenase [cytochrome], mitochondrial-like isoform X1 [Selaginella moellendorffii]|uniref:D-lactate dehydrogenase [cytochrome], mitochondrial-like isoform X1 n=1 Tax=Selaginella moellendorffii TaxID=88036 RepID=UPI000D1CF316|nr:D-lactate dehydrogenase [cytochrome], mitochondrial-like isoform X1 [Selaginella moellendorffii]|eukprot:XP_024521697.1 D-lactate dehydrogenase [cytochrome], mitochondrial-like isoform X1 [Selaginella moellendorffii]
MAFRRFASRVLASRVCGVRGASLLSRRCLETPIFSSGSSSWNGKSQRLAALGAAGVFTFALVELGFNQAALLEQDEQKSVEALVTTKEARKLDESFISELQAIFEAERIAFDPDERFNHGKPWNTYHPVEHIPDVVVYPRSADEVQAAVKLCAKYKVPVVPFGGATSLEGQTLTPSGGVSIDMQLMKKVKALHIEDMDVVVEPGLGWIELNEFLKPYGLFFPLDPGPGATIGGMCATRCSGSLAVRYGTMRDNVISLKAVVANGDQVKSGSRARKSAAGYDLTRLMIGSEGTLGVITEVTLRLQKIPEASIVSFRACLNYSQCLLQVAMCNFPSVKDAADVAIATMHLGIQVSRVELLDEMQVKAINLANGRNYPEQPTLMFEFIGTENYALEQAKLVHKIVVEHSGSDFVYSNTPEEKEDLWKVRKEAFWACSTLRPGAEAMVTDVCVPLSRLAECISTSKAILDASSLPSAIISHAGDGNFHTVILFDPANKDEAEEAQHLCHKMVHIALAMEGTCTGEHGVGVGKMKYLEAEFGSEALSAMGKIKKCLDPDNIMNPGKIIPRQFCC